MYRQNKPWIKSQKEKLIRAAFQCHFKTTVLKPALKLSNKIS